MVQTKAKKEAFFLKKKSCLLEEGAQVGDVEGGQNVDSLGAQNHLGRRVRQNSSSSW